jgi:hypothetical protein
VIISHTHKFIFLKTRKTASTSAEIALSRICGETDIIAPITPRDETLRLDAGRACQNFGAKEDDVASYLQSLRSDEPPVDIPPALKRSSKFPSHMSLSKILAKEPLDLSIYRTISIERHPYDKVVSYANFILGFEGYKRGENLDADNGKILEILDRLLEPGELDSKIRNWDIYTCDGEMQVDHMLRYEHLESDFHAACEILGIDQVPDLPVTKRGCRDRSVPARDLLSSAQK